MFCKTKFYSNDKLSRTISIRFNRFSKIITLTSWRSLVLVKCGRALARWLSLKGEILGNFGDVDFSLTTGRSDDSLRGTAAHCRDLTRCGVADRESGTATAASRIGSGSVGEAKRSNLRTWAETLPRFSERIFCTEGRPVKGIRMWSKWRFRISPLVHWHPSGVV